MPVTARTQRECFNTFSDHMRRLLINTVSERYPFMPRRKDRHVIDLTFQGHDSLAIPINTQFGKFYLSLMQRLETVEEDSKFRLRIQNYWYHLYTDPCRDSEPILRWEYDRGIPFSRHCQSHVHVRTRFDLDGGRSLHLNKIHLPTSRVSVESIIRMLIVDFGMFPPCGLDCWADVLYNSERTFMQTVVEDQIPEEALSEV